MRTERGPTFSRVHEVPVEGFDFRRHARGRRRQPVVVKGAVTRWPAWRSWSFEALADVCEQHPGGTTAVFKNGLVEQGVTQPTIVQPIAPYLRDLAEQARQTNSDTPAFVSLEQLKRTGPDERFTLDWSRLAFTPDKTYLQQWELFDDLPHLAQDLDTRTLWPGVHATWKYVFFGPANTLTGLHYDYSHNWFGQIRGTKEVLLFDHDESSHLSPGRKYDWGSVLSDLDISRRAEQPELWERFTQARGTYVRLEAGDALFIPRRTWHSIVALTPSISVGTFGLNPLEIACRGTALSIGKVLHHAHLYRWGNCVCHATSTAASIASSR
jgi:hypothetical protein